MKPSDTAYAFLGIVALACMIVTLLATIYGFIAIGQFLERRKIASTGHLVVSDVIYTCEPQSKK